MQEGNCYRPCPGLLSELRHIPIVGVACLQLPDDGDRVGADELGKGKAEVRWHVEAAALPAVTRQHHRGKPATPIARRVRFALQMGKMRTRLLLSSTTTKAPDARSASCCRSAATTNFSRWSGSTSWPRT